MALRGERFEIDLPPDEDGGSLEQAAAVEPDPVPAFVKDIRERPPPPSSSARPPSAPSARPTPTGFPAHKKRVAASRFKQQRGALTAPQTDSTSLVSGDADPADAAGAANRADPASHSEKREIDAENRRRLAQMSDEDIEKERRELLSSLSPSLIERLLRRSNIDDPNASSNQQDYPQISTRDEAADDTAKTKTVRFDQSSTVPSDRGPQETRSGLTAEEDDDEEEEDVAESKVTDPSMPDPPASIHFPRPPEPPQLDPSSPTFLTDLHDKYFPSLPTDPSKLAWMTDPPTASSADDDADADAAYSATQPSLPASALRFSFRGALLPPRTARAIPVTQGLHHHGDAPDSAGYTIPELARLARSAFPAQRCVAYQTLGRVLYRLGAGEFGPPEADLARGLWRCVDDGRVLDSLRDEAERGGHVSAKAYATEALWNWRRGGGQRWKAE